MSLGKPAAGANRKPCLEKATDLLSRRSHFRAQLATKLSRRAYPVAEIERALDRLTELGYLDDLRTAEELITLRRARGEGRRRIEAELRKRGAPPDTVAQALEALPGNDHPQAREAAERWLRARSHDSAAPLPPRDAQALTRHLARKGYDQGTVYRVLEELGGMGGGEEEG